MSLRTPILRLALALALGASAAFGAPAPETKVLQTPRFEIHYTPRAEGTARSLARRIEDVRDEFKVTLGRDWPGVTQVLLGFDRTEFEALASTRGKPPAWAIALAYPSENVILVDAHALHSEQGPLTLRHEVSHVALGQLGGPWPRWFQEGLALYLTGERNTLPQYTALFRGVTQDRIFHFEHLGDRWPEEPWDVEIAYAQSVSFVSFLRHRHGAEGFGKLLDHVHAGEPFETAFGKAFRTSLWLEETEWRSDLPNKYSWWPIVTGGSSLWVLATLIAAVAYLRRRAQKAVTLRRMDDEEAREAEEALAELSAVTEGEDPEAKTKPTLH